MAKYPFRLPDIGEGIAEAEIVAWHVAVGDTVQEDQPIADLMTDKATIEMTAPVAGIVTELSGAVGETVAIGSILITFDTGGDVEASTEQETPSERPKEAKVEPKTEAKTEAAPAAKAQQEPAALMPKNSSRVLASPAVRARANELGIDLASLKPAQGDRVRHSDLDAYLRYGSGGQRLAPSVDQVEEIKLIGLRRRIAEKMAEAKRNIPHFAYVEECDVTELERMREVINAGRRDRPKLTVLPFLVRAMCKAIVDFPMVNARFDDAAGVISRHSAVHMGIAAQTDNGLMVPVLRDAQTLDVWQIAAEVARLAEGARNGRLSSSELSGSTITLSSLGPLGGIVSTPILNRPEVAIVGVNRMVERPLVINGQIEVRKTMNLSSSFDHRIVDGHDAASFIQRVRQLIEAPALILA